MRYQVRHSSVDVVGRIWTGQQAAYAYKLDDSTIQRIREFCAEDIDRISHKAHEGICRDSVEDWLNLNSGDFQSIEDFRVTISAPDGLDFDSDFVEEDNEVTFDNFISEECCL